MVEVGDKVRHPNQPGWGLGKVLEVAPSGNARIFFIHVGEKLLGLKYVALEKVTGADAAHPILDSPTFGQRVVSGKKHIGLPEARLDFLEIFVEGFDDPAYLETERTYKVKARDLLLETLNKEAFAALLAEGNVEEIVLRALRVANKTNLIFPNEKMAFKDGLNSPERKQLFAQRLFELLYGDAAFRVRFEAFSACLERMQADKWTTATYFPFLAFPEEHMFLKPEITKHAADLTKAELNYKSELNWLTYSCLLEFSRYLRDELVKMGMPPRDMIDVQSFMWCITPGKYDMVEGAAFVPSGEKYRKALRSMEVDGLFDENQYRTMLKAQYTAPGHVITATRLAEAAGYANYNAANLQYGTLGRKLALYLGYLPPKYKTGERMWWQTLSSGNEASSQTIDGHFEFVMRPEMAAALKELRWV